MILQRLMKYIRFAEKHYDNLSHPIHVALQFEEWEDEWIVGLFHDLLEDTSVKEEELYQLLEEDSKEYLIEDIKVLTRSKNDTYFDYIRKIKQHSGIAIKVKLTDIKHHFERKDTLKESLKKRYEKAVKILKGEIE